MVSEINVWVWLSLVEYLNGVQGVGGSNPLTQTSTEETESGLFRFISWLCYVVTTTQKT